MPQIGKIKQISFHKPAKLCKKTKPKTIWEIYSSPSPCFPLSPTWEKHGEGLEFPILPFVAPPGQTMAKVQRLRAHIYDREDTVFGPILSLPFESRLRVIAPLDSSSTSRWIKVALPNNREVYIQRGDVELNSKNISNEEMCQLSKRFLDLPYTWGGRSSFGYDCSGFTQMLYRQRGIFLPRDSRDQVKSPLLREISLDKLQPGDLVFFGIDESKIRHVGLYLGNDQFIHSTVAENAPYIRISQLSSPEWNGSGKYPYRALRTLGIVQK